MERLLRRSADASLLAMTIIFPSLRAIFCPSLRASRRSNLPLPCPCEPSFVRHCEPAGFPSLRASRRGNPSLPSLNDLAKIAASLGYRLAPRNDYNTLSPLRRSADALLLAMTIIFPSLRAIFRPSLRASRRGNPSLPSLRASRRSNLPLPSL